MGLGGREKVVNHDEEIMDFSDHKFWISCNINSVYERQIALNNWIGKTETIPFALNPINPSLFIDISCPTETEHLESVWFIDS